MKVKLKEAIQRLAWRFTDSKSVTNGFKPNQNDAEALNAIIEYVNKTTENTVKDNRLFTKMYVAYFCLQLRVYRDFDLAQKKTNQVLNTPTQTLYELLRQEANVCEVKAHFDDLGFKTDSEMTPQTFKDNLKKAKEVDAKRFLEVCNTWDTKESYNNINAIVALAFNQFKDKE